jgi:photosystem II PsbU protein
VLRILIAIAQQHAVMVSSTVVVIVALLATIECAVSQDEVSDATNTAKALSKSFAVSPAAPAMRAGSVSRAVPVVAGLPPQGLADAAPRAPQEYGNPAPIASFQQYPGFEQPTTDAHKVVMEMQGAKPKSNLRGHMQHTHEQTLNSFIMGSIALVGLAASMGIAAFKKLTSMRQPTSEPAEPVQDAGISMLRLPAVEPAQVAGAVAAAAIAIAQPAQPALAVSQDYNSMTGMASANMMKIEKKMTTEDKITTLNRRFKTDSELLYPGIAIVGTAGILFSKWAGYQEDQVDFFDGYDSRRTDRSAMANKWYDSGSQATLKRQGMRAAPASSKEPGFYQRMFGAPEYVDVSESPSGRKGSRTRTRSAPARMSAADEPIARRELLAKAAGASALFATTAANAEIDYAGVGFLGGATTIDVNNANVRVYCKKPGLYPSAAGKIVSNAPYKSKDDMYAKAGFTEKEKEVVKKYDSQFVFLEPRPEYIIDNINNGLYR